MMAEMFRSSTIAQYHIRKWLEANFYAGSLTLTPISGTEVMITDGIGGIEVVKYKDGEIYLVEAETPAGGQPGNLYS